MKQYTIGDSTITVVRDGKSLNPDGWRQRYSYSIVTPEWHYSDNDLSSGIGDAVDEASATSTLLAFLSACAESRLYRSRNGYGGVEADLFPDHVGEWAEEYADEITMLSMELEDEE